MKVESILRQKGEAVVTTRRSASLKSAADRMRLENIAALVVVEDERIAGLISEREIVHAFARHGEAVASLKVDDAMVREVLTCAPDDDLARLMSLMTRHRARHLPVVRNGRLAGIVSIGDIVKHRLGELELETNVLRDAYLAAR